MSKQFTLGKNERLKSRKQIEKLFAKGRSMVVSPFRVYYDFNIESRNSNGNRPLQVGVGVSSRNFKRAVDRNRIKRWTREAWRLQNQELKNSLKSNASQVMVFLIYTGKDLPDFTLVKDKVAVALKKIVEKTNERVTQDP